MQGVAEFFICIIPQTLVGDCTFSARCNTIVILIIHESFRHCECYNHCCSIINIIIVITIINLVISVVIIILVGFVSKLLKKI